MRKLLVVSLFVATAALAGSRFVQNQGQLPTKSTDGVALAWMTACRASIWFGDGGTTAGGSLVPYYYDTASAVWTEAKPDDWCTLATTNQIDGGARVAQNCEWTVQSPFGRVAVAQAVLTPQAIANQRLECWGQFAGGSDGGVP